MKAKINFSVYATIADPLTKARIDNQSRSDRRSTEFDGTPDAA